MNAVSLSVGRFHADFNKVIVQAYKIAGFVALTTILLGLVSFFAVHAFYYVSHSWAKPLIFSPGDKQVLDLRTQLAQEESQRDHLVTQRLDLQVRLEDQDRIVAAEEAFQADYGRMLSADIAFRKQTLARLSRVSLSHSRAASAIARANRDYASVARSDAKSLLDAHIITKNEAVTTAEQNANLATATLGLDAKGAELQTEVSSLARDIDSLAIADATLRATAGPAPSEGAMSHDVLAMKRDYDRSKLEASRARAAKVALQRSIAMTDTSIARFEGLVKSINDSPYLRALDRHVAIAFVPYDNLGSAVLGANVYACRANFFWCRKVGTVLEVAGGEVTSKHPTQSVDVRGVLVEIELSEFEAAENAVLHLGRAPLLL